MFELPLWEPRVEFWFSIGNLIWLAFLLFIIATSQLHCVIRALLITNTISVILMSVGQLAISLWCIEGNRVIGASEFHFFVPIMIHQSGYYMCATSFVLITGERLLLCYKPYFYDLYHPTFTASFVISLTIELSVLFPILVAVQYDSLKVGCAMFVGIQQIVSFSLLISCYRKSSLYYRTKFRNVNLNSRYQVKGVIELTRACIPLFVCAVSVKGLMFVLAVVCIQTEDFADDAHFILRVACTVYSICMPFLLIFRVKTLMRRYASFFPRCKIESNSTLQSETTDAATRKYFEELRKQWA